jgi:glycosyltransferase involved in cell wall biosynthesis
MGRLEEAKGFGYLIDAIPGLLRRYPDLIIAIAGQGPLRDALERRAAELGVAGSVRFVGFCADVQRFYDALDVFVLPSLCETLGYVLLEAMATSLPVVGTRVGGVPEVISDGESGLLVPPRDPAAIARAIESLLGSEELRSRFGREGQQRVVEEFHERDMVRRTVELYRDVLRRTRRPRPRLTQEVAS